MNVQENKTWFLLSQQVAKLEMLGALIFQAYSTDVISEQVYRENRDRLEEFLGRVKAAGNNAPVADHLIKEAQKVKEHLEIPIRIIFSKAKKYDQQAA